VVLKRDRMPLSSQDGPFEVIVPGEKRNSRWVRQLVAVKIRQVE